MTILAYLKGLEAAAEAARSAEMAFRREATRRIGRLENERAFAFRRHSLLRAVAAVVVSAAEEAVAVDAALAIVSSRLGWSEREAARAAILDSFAPVARAIYVANDPARPGDAKDITAALAGFEAWYQGAHGVAFWDLFELELPETPRVDF